MYTPPDQTGLKEETELEQMLLHSMHLPCPHLLSHSPLLIPHSFTGEDVVEKGKKEGEEG